MEGQAMLEEYVPELKYRAKDAKQLTIKKMIMNYVINCTVPLSHVENEDFRAMISSCEKKFSHFTRYDRLSTIWDKVNIARQKPAWAVSPQTNWSVTISGHYLVSMHALDIWKL